MKDGIDKLMFNPLAGTGISSVTAGPAAAVEPLTLNTLIEMKQKIGNILKGTFPPPQFYCWCGDSPEKKSNVFGSPYPLPFPSPGSPHPPTMISQYSAPSGAGGGPFMIKPFPLLTVQVQYFFPKTKKRRIQKKAAKKYVRQVPDLSTVYFVNNHILLCHPLLVPLLEKSLKGEIR